jgi:dihydroorotate dehydrogenase electron transfer subunit
LNNHSVTVISLTNPAPGYVRLSLDAPNLAPSMTAGQFVHVSCGNIREMFLRRPFSLHRYIAGETGVPTGFEIVFHVKGRGTTWLAERRPGDRIEMMGPLGMGFDVRRNAGRNALIVAGGIGVAPLPALVTNLREQGRETTVLLGARTEAGLLCEEDVREAGATVEVTTEDGSRGMKGLISHLVEQKLADETPELFICGPAPMLAVVARQAIDHDVPCQVSLEAAMGCGVGACLGCMVPATGGGYRRVCLEGPIFSAHDIAWTDYVETVRRAQL